METAEKTIESTEEVGAVSMSPSTSLLDTCSTCRHWEPEPHHKLWGRCGRRDDKMCYGARSYYPYDCKPAERLRDGWEISTYKDFGCNRYVPNAEAEPSAGNDE